MTRRIILITVAAVTALAGAIFWTAALAHGFAGINRWKVAGIKFHLLVWSDGAWHGTVLMLVTITCLALAWPRPADGIIAARKRRGWTLFGGWLGAAAGLLLSIHYYYLIPNPGLRAMTVIAGGAAGAVIHFGFFALTELIYARRPGWAPYGRASILLVVWTALLTGPLRSWEAVGTEPIGGQFLLAASVGAAFAVGLWLLGKKIFRRAVVAAAVIVAAGIALSGTGGLVENAPRRVILITLDTTRADYLSCYGFPEKTSPNLDRLAASGVRFSRAYCNYGITDPSHVSILTGTYPRTHGVIGNHYSVSGKVHSLAEDFLDRGYTTAAIVSREHLLPTSLGVNGFMDESGPAGWMISTTAREAFRRTANLFARNPDGDVFLWLHLFDPHQPYLRHPEDWPVRHQGLRIHGGPDFPKPGETFTSEEIAGVRDLYAGEIAYTDRWLGRIFQLLDSLPGGPEANMIIVTADHGEILGEFLHRPIRYGFGHGPVYLPGVHVPLIISSPGRVPAGRVVDDVAESVDIAPTISRLALGMDFRAQGQSLTGMIAGQTTDGRAVIEGVIYTTRPSLDSAVVEGDWKLLVNEKKALELYETRSDPGEERNLLSGQPDQGTRLFGLYEEWQRKTPETKPEVRTLSDRDQRRLKALGYVDK